MTAGAAVVETKAPSVAVERTKDGTLYWTLSIYFEANAVEACAKKRLSSDIFRQAQLKHPPSLTLRNAIDPLFNDIGDLERRQEEKRTQHLGAIATAIGITSGLALFFNVADFVERWAKARSSGRFSFGFRPRCLPCSGRYGCCASALSGRGTSCDSARKRSRC